MVKNKKTEFYFKTHLSKKPGIGLDTKKIYFLRCFELDLAYSGVNTVMLNSNIATVCLFVSIIQKKLILILYLLDYSIRKRKKTVFSF